MSKIRYLVIEDSLVISQFRKDLPKERSLFCRTYADAQQSINDLELASDEYLCVILDHQLGDPEGKSGVDLFFQIRKKFPDAHIINFSSEPEKFLKEVQLRYTGVVRDFDAPEIKVTFDDTAVGKFPHDAIARARRYQAVRNTAFLAGNIAAVTASAVIVELSSQRGSVPASKENNAVKYTAHERRATIETLSSGDTVVLHSHKVSQKKQVPTAKIDANSWFFLSLPFAATARPKKDSEKKQVAQVKTKADPWFSFFSGFRNQHVRVSDYKISPSG